MLVLLLLLQMKDDVRPFGCHFRYLFDGGSDQACSSSFKRQPFIP